ncbi:hypothetical protein Tco_0162687, partial [Tanacetum coccineum]
RAKCDILVDNLSEASNSKLINGRYQPIIGRLENIREYLMKLIVNVQHVIERRDSPLTPTTIAISSVIIKDANDYIVIWNGGDIYQCKRLFTNQCAMNMNLKTCTCRRWEFIEYSMTRNPIRRMASSGYDIYISSSWLLSEVSGTDTIPSFLLPPHYHVTIGRPVKKRRVAEGVKSEKILKRMGSRKNARPENVPDFEPSEAVGGSSNPMDSQAKQQVGSQGRRIPKRVGKEPKV